MSEDTKTKQYKIKHVGQMENKQIYSVDLGSGMKGRRNPESRFSLIASVVANYAGEGKTITFYGKEGFVFCTNDSEVAGLLGHQPIMKTALTDWLGSYCKKLMNEIVWHHEDVVATEYKHTELLAASRAASRAQQEVAL